MVGDPSQHATVLRLVLVWQTYYFHPMFWQPREITILLVSSLFLSHFWGKIRPNWRTERNTKRRTMFDNQAQLTCVTASTSHPSGTIRLCHCQESRHSNHQHTRHWEQHHRCHISLCSQQGISTTGWIPTNLDAGSTIAIGKRSTLSTRCRISWIDCITKIRTFCSTGNIDLGTIAVVVIQIERFILVRAKERIIGTVAIVDPIHGISLYYSILCNVIAVGCSRNITSLVAILLECHARKDIVLGTTHNFKIGWICPRNDGPCQEYDENDRNVFHGLLLIQNKGYGSLAVSMFLCIASGCRLVVCGPKIILKGMTKSLIFSNLLWLRILLWQHSADVSARIGPVIRLWVARWEVMRSRTTSDLYTRKMSLQKVDGSAQPWRHDVTMNENLM